MTAPTSDLDSIVKYSIESNIELARAQYAVLKDSEKMGWRVAGTLSTEIQKLRKVANDLALEVQTYLNHPIQSHQDDMESALRAYNALQAQAVLETKEKPSEDEWEKSRFGRD